MLCQILDFSTINVYWLLSFLCIALFAPRSLRTLYNLVARPFGLANPDHFHIWIIIPWRPVMMKFIRLGEWFEQTFSMGRKATARWASYRQRACLVYKSGRVLYGRQQLMGLPLYQPIGEDCERHLAMIAGTGSGKTTQLITMLSLHMGNIFCVDPKGQIFRSLHHRCGKGGNGLFRKRLVHSRARKSGALDPLGVVTGYASMHWNPIEEIHQAAKRHGLDVAPRFAMKMAEGLIVKPPHENNPFFTNSARMFVQALLLYVYVAEAQGLRHIIRFRDLLTGGLPPQGPIRDPMDMLLFEMEQRQEFDGMIARTAVSLRTSSDKSRGDVLSTAREQTKWLDLPEVRAISTRSDFHMADLKTGALSLFICSPATDIRSTLSGWFRILTVMGLYVFENIPGRMKTPCYFALDEMPSIGAVESIEISAPLMRGYGVRLLCISQGVKDLAAVYPHTWQKFLGNADAVYWLGMGAADTESPAELARILGTATYKENVGGGRFSKLPKRYNKTERPLVYPEQIPRLLRGGNIIVTRYDQRHLRLKSVPYYRELPVTYYAADPEHGDTKPRALTRRFLRWLFSEKIDYAQAMQIFGLAPGYKRLDIENRYALLQPACDKSREFALSVKRARSLLLRGVD